MTGHGPEPWDDEDGDEARFPRGDVTAMRVHLLVWSVVTAAFLFGVTAVTAAGFAHGLRGGPAWGLALYAVAGLVVVALVMVAGNAFVLLFLTAADDMREEVADVDPVTGESDFDPKATPCLVSALVIPAALVVLTVGLVSPGWLGPIDGWGRALAEALGLR